MQRSLSQPPVRRLLPKHEGPSELAVYHHVLIDAPRQHVELSAKPLKHETGIFVTRVIAADPHNRWRQIGGINAVTGRVDRETGFHEPEGYTASNTARSPSHQSCQHTPWQANKK